MFEFLILESFQAGLSWRTVLHKREQFRSAFANFAVDRVAAFTGRDVRRLLNDAGIIRNRLKILAAINNAQQFIEVQQEFRTFTAYLWSFVQNRPIQNAWSKSSQIPAVTLLAETLAADLKRRGFKFLGPTVVYAHLQATGLINDHLTTCFRYRQLGGGKRR